MKLLALLFNSWLLPVALTTLSIANLRASDVLIDHEFHGTGANAVLEGATGKYNGKKITFSDQTEPNRYFLYYQAKSPFGVSIADSPANELIAEPALLMKREAGGPVDFGGLSIAVNVASWEAGEVTVESLDSLRLDVSLAATSGLKTSIFFEITDSAGKFLMRTALPVKIDNDGLFHDYSFSFFMLPEAEKKRLVKALNQEKSTNINLNFPLAFSEAESSPAPFLAIKKLKLLKE